ncbi:MAG: PaaI family thioesterase [Deltaproteobacteria bacterium]|nr:PaaI family thioesterase [Deltaproteobacteria bacterium]
MTETKAPSCNPVLLANPYSTSNCFFCGENNPRGAHLEFWQVNDDPLEVVCHWTPGPDFSGLGRVLHGGIQSGLFDEIMGWTAHHVEHTPGVTTELRVKFLRPLYVEEPLELRCRVAGREGRRVDLAAELLGPDGEVAARASGSYVLMDPERFFGLVRSAGS